MFGFYFHLGGTLKHPERMGHGQRMIKYMIHNIHDQIVVVTKATSGKIDDFWEQGIGHVVLQDVRHSSEIVKRMLKDIGQFHCATCALQLGIMAHLLSGQFLFVKASSWLSPIPRCTEKNGRLSYNPPIAGGTWLPVLMV